MRKRTFGQRIYNKLLTDDQFALHNAAAQRFVEQRRDEQRQRELAAALDALPSVVYFARVGDYIKIGTTKSLKRRRRELSIQLTDILAVMPGGLTEERQMHERFAEALAKGLEWFHPTPELIAFINEIRDRCGVPAIDPIA